ncbi:MAG: SRPBCC family protein [Bacteroidales bacterium]|nr:SRPBCC family protein [Bacteroidales bacterium]
MTKVESKTVEIDSKAEKIFDFLTDFTHFSLLLPDKVENWKATKDKCSFTIKGFTDFGMKIAETTPYSSILITNDEEVKMPIKFTFTWNFSPLSDNKTRVIAVFNLDMNPMMAMMVKNPLKNFIDVLVDKLKEKIETDI